MVGASFIAALLYDMCKRLVQGRLLNAEFEIAFQEAIDNTTDQLKEPALGDLLMHLFENKRAQDLMEKMKERPSLVSVQGLASLMGNIGDYDSSTLNVPLELIFSTFLRNLENELANTSVNGVMLSYFRSFEERLGELKTGHKEIKSMLNILIERGEKERQSGEATSIDKLIKENKTGGSDG